MRQPAKGILKQQAVAGAFLFSITFLLPPPTALSHNLMVARNSHLVYSSTLSAYKTRHSQTFAFSASIPTPTPTSIYTTTPIPLPTFIPSPTITPTPTLFAIKTIIPPRNFSYQTPKNGSLDPLFSRYASEFGVNEGLLKRIAYCESRYNPNAVGGPYAGLFQFHAGTWIKERNRHGWDAHPNLRFNAEEAIKTASAKIAGGGIRAWPNCGR